MVSQVYFNMRNYSFFPVYMKQTMGWVATIKIGKLTNRLQHIVM